MRIKNISSLSPALRHSASDINDHTVARSSSESPHVMVSRINGRVDKIDSTSRTSNQEQDRDIDHEEMNFAKANQRQNNSTGGWREEEKAMPLKKRRRISFEEIDSINGRVKIVKGEGEEGDMRCGRTDGRRWRCSRRRVDGYSMCEHHMLTRSARYRSEYLMKIEIGEDDDEEEKKEKEEGCFGKCENEDANNNNTNNKRKVKARSIDSLLRDTVPLK